jgi:GrpB-like predicted nucleotidyltransferase (UPF0157 family)
VTLLPTRCFERIGRRIEDYMGQVTVVDYDPNWPRLFETLSAPISELLAGVAISIEHVGSTAVPGLAAKPVIDIDVVVLPPDVSTGIARLQGFGYQHLGDRGVPQREAFRRPPGSAVHHLYLCPSTSPALANHLAIRDHLRANPPAARAYGALKKRLAIDFAHDVDGYVEAKTAFLVAILRQRGFHDDVLSEIERINRRPTATG